MMIMMNKTYSELISIPTFQERYKYLRIGGSIGEDTFGFNRWVNQVLYTSLEWKSLRKKIIVRDNGSDLACEGFEIFGKMLIHHINPITYDDVVERSPIIFDPNNLITTNLDTHNAIHYGNSKVLKTGPIVRTKNDTCPWR